MNPLSLCPPGTPTFPFFRWFFSSGVGGISIGPVVKLTMYLPQSNVRWKFDYTACSEWQCSSVLFFHSCYILFAPICYTAISYSTLPSPSLPTCYILPIRTQADHSDFAVYLLSALNVFSTTVIIFVLFFNVPFLFCKSCTYYSTTFFSPSVFHVCNHYDAMTFKFKFRFRITDPLWGESTGPLWISPHKVPVLWISHVSLLFFAWANHSMNYWIIGDLGCHDIRHHCHEQNFISFFIHIWYH